MRFTTSVSDLLGAITHASAVTPAKSASLVSYTGIMVEARKDDVRVSGSDGEITVSVHVPADVEATGKTLVIPKNIRQWLTKTDRDARVQVQLDKSGKLSVSAGAKPYKFNTMVATFPTPTAKTADLTEIDLKALASALPAVKDVAGEVVAGTGQNAVNLELTDDRLQLSSTDLLRVARARVVNSTTGSLSALLEVRAVELAMKMGSTHAGVDKSGKVATFCGPNHVITVRTLEAAFPPVDNILTNRPSFKVTIPQSRVLEAIERLASVSADNSPLLLEIDGHSLTLTSHSVAVGEGVEDVELSHAAPAPVTLGANLDFVKNAVAFALGQDVTLSWTSPVMPVFVESKDSCEVTSVLMPMKLSD